MSTVLVTGASGMRVEPPTRITWSIFDLSKPASRMAWSNGPWRPWSFVTSWNRARVSVSSRCSGPSLVAVTNGRLIVVFLQCRES